MSEVNIWMWANWDQNVMLEPSEQTVTSRNILLFIIIEPNGAVNMNGTIKSL